MKMPLILKLGFCVIVLAPAIAWGQVRPHLTSGKLEQESVAPSLDLNGAEAGNDFSTSYTQGGGSIAIVDGNASDNEALTVGDDTNHLVSATIRLTNSLDGAAETMGVSTTGTNIAASLGAAGASRTLTLTGYDSKSAYQQVLRTAIYLNTANPINTTTRTIEFRINDGTLESPIATTTISVSALPTPTPTPAPPTTLANISTRLRVETDDNVLIGGFIITGTQPKRILVRAIGPSTRLVLALFDPTLQLRDSAGTLLAENDNWRSHQEAEIIGTTIPPESDFESAIVQTLPANNSAYTAIVRGVENQTGIGVVEIYDLDTAANSKLANISTRGFVLTGDNALIAGTIVLGQLPQRVLIRAIGPSLTVPGKMEDPILELRDSSGTIVAQNDNWRIGGQEAEIIATTIPPSNEAESAIIASLNAGGASYTAIVRGVDNATGIAVVEIYALN